MAASNGSSDVVRGCANYKPTIWGYDYIQSLKIEYTGKRYSKRHEELQAEVKTMLTEAVEPLNQLKLVDVLQRLGLRYHYEDEVRSILESFNSKNEETNVEDESHKRDLYAASLEFRLLRQNGYKASIEIFDKFEDDTNEIGIAADVDAMLALYEASFLCLRSESMLKKARDFASKYLKEYLENSKGSNDVKSSLVRHALEIPLHWRMVRVEARWFIDVYERMEDVNPTVLEFAKLDYNMVQAIHQEEIKEVSRWWKESDLANQMSFARDRIMECFLWSMGLRFEPIHRYYRVMMTKLLLMFTIIDDVYDVPYGTAEEVELFTMAVRSWDIDSVDTLPDYLKSVYLAFFNIVNDSVFYTLKEQGLYVMKYARMGWQDVCDCYLIEAKWLRAKYEYTSLQQYIENGWRTIGLQTTVYATYFTMVYPLTNDILSSLKEFPSFFRPASIVLRLADDVGSFSRELKAEQNDLSNAVYVYMKETGRAEKEAVEYVKELIEKNWEDMNEDLIGASSFPFIFIETAMHGSRIGITEYQQGDGFTTQNQWNKDLTLSLFINPIPMP